MKSYNIIFSLTSNFLNQPCLFLISKPCDNYDTLCFPQGIANEHQFQIHESVQFASEKWQKKKEYVLKVTF